MTKRKRLILTQRVTYKNNRYMGCRVLDLESGLFFAWDALHTTSSLRAILVLFLATVRILEHGQQTFFFNAFALFDELF